MIPGERNKEKERRRERRTLAHVQEAIHDNNASQTTQGEKTTSKKKGKK